MSVERAPAPAPKYPPDIDVGRATFLVRDGSGEIFVAPGTGVQAGLSCFVVVDASGAASACGDPDRVSTHGTEYAFERPDGSRELWAYVPAGYERAEAGSQSVAIENRVLRMVVPPTVREITLTAPDREPATLKVPGPRN